MGKDERTIQDCPKCGGRGYFEKPSPPNYHVTDPYVKLSCSFCGGTGHVVGVNPDDPTMPDVLKAAVELLREYDQRERPNKIAVSGYPKWEKMILNRARQIAKEKR